MEVLILSDDDITGFVELYIKNLDLLEDAAKLISTDLQKGMRDQLWVGHGYDTGQLYRDIYSNYSVNDSEAVIVGGFTVEHGDYVIRGVRGKGQAKSGPIPFLTMGLEAALENYR